MTEEQKQPETGTAPGTQPQAQSTQAEPVFTLTQSALNAMLADQKRTLLSELEQLRGKASKWEEHEKSQMTEMEKLQRRVAELEPLATTAQQYEASIKAILEKRVQSLPEQYRDALPALPPAQQLEWIEQAIAKGMFTLQPQQQEKQKVTPPPYDSKTGVSAGQGTGLTQAQEATALRLGLTREQYAEQLTQVRLKNG